jgi:hypothetical protein
MFDSPPFRSPHRTYTRVARSSSRTHPPLATLTLYSNEEAVAFVIDFLKIGCRPEQVCSRMLDYCLKLNSRDNMTAVLVLFPAAPVKVEGHTIDERWEYNMMRNRESISAEEIKAVRSMLMGGEGALGGDDGDGGLPEEGKPPQLVPQPPSARVMLPSGTAERRKSRRSGSEKASVPPAPRRSRGSSFGAEARVGMGMGMSGSRGARSSRSSRSSVGSASSSSSSMGGWSRHGSASTSRSSSGGSRRADSASGSRSSSGSGSRRVDSRGGGAGAGCAGGVSGRRSSSAGKSAGKGSGASDDRNDEGSGNHPSPLHRSVPHGSSKVGIGSRRRTDSQFRSF